MVISIILFIVICVSVWAIFFKPEENISTYENVLNSVIYENSINADKTLQDLKTKTGTGSDYSNEFNLETHNEIIAIRNKIFSNGTNNKITIGSFTFYNYLEINKSLSDALNQYLAYSKLATGATKINQSKISGLVGKFEESIEKLDLNISQVTTSQKNYTILEGEEDNEVANADLTQLYRILQLQYRVMLKAKADLIIGLRSFIIQYAFNKNYSDLAISVLRDAIAYSISGAFSVSYETENGYLNDITSIIDTYQNYINGVNIYSGITSESEFVGAYRKLYYEDIEDLEYAFKITHETKVLAISDDAFVISNIKAEYQNQVKLIFKVMNI